MDLSSKYPAATKEAIDFLNKTLVLNPFFRMNLDEAISHPMFDQVRNKEAESVPGKEVILEFEKMTLDKDTLRHLFTEEILQSRR